MANAVCIVEGFLFSIKQYDPTKKAVINGSYSSTSFFHSLHVNLESGRRHTGRVCYDAVDSAKQIKSISVFVSNGYRYKYLTV